MSTNGIRIEYGGHGRWGGRLTQRPLPEEDASILALHAKDRARLAEIWLVRAAMERRVADSFVVIRDALARLRAAADLVILAERAIDDEFRHTELSRFVASRFAGRELPTPPLRELEVPAHRGASPELRDALFVVGQCVLNETTAGAFLETCLSHAEGPLAKSALRELLGDEIDHGRLGWTFLASVDDATRAAIGPWLLPMAYLNLRQWKRETPYQPNDSEVLALHGAPSAKVLHPALVDAQRTLVIPGLRALGMATTSLERWLDAGADTDSPPVEFVGRPSA